MKLWIHKLLKIYSKSIFLSKNKNKNLTFQKQTLKILRSGLWKLAQKTDSSQTAENHQAWERYFFPWKKSDTRNGSRKPPNFWKSKKLRQFWHTTLKNRNRWFSKIIENRPTLVLTWSPCGLLRTGMFVNCKPNQTFVTWKPKNKMCSVFIIEVKWQLQFHHLFSSALAAYFYKWFTYWWGRPRRNTCKFCKCMLESSIKSPCLWAPVWPSKPSFVPNLS
jgi:hypothetical protein